MAENPPAKKKKKRKTWWQENGNFVLACIGVLLIFFSATPGGQMCGLGILIVPTILWIAAAIQRQGQEIRDQHRESRDSDDRFSDTDS